MEHQDWEYKVVEKPGTGKQAMANLQNQGKVETVAKHEHLNKVELDGKHIAKVLNEEKYTVDHVSHDFRIALQQARQAKGLTQKKFALLVSESENSISNYENGKAIPNITVIQKFEHALGVKLPREQKH